MSALPKAEIHIAGVLVHARPEFAEGIAAAIGALPAAEVTHQAQDGRIVTVLEAPDSHRIMEQIDAIRALRGVLNVALVYQHAEAEEELRKEIQE
jgi:periplasmic nitrate reductase NapD